MTRNRAGAGNAPQPLNVEYYVQRASAGLIITEGSQVAAEAVGYPATPGIHSAEQVAGWKKITDAVHAQGGRIFLQLWHCGRISHPSLLPGGMLPVAPSAIKPSGQAVTPEGMKPFETPHALALSGIPGIIEQFRSGARNALDAGFDGVDHIAERLFARPVFARRLQPAQRRLRRLDCQPRALDAGSGRCGMRRVGRESCRHPLVAVAAVQRHARFQSRSDVRLHCRTAQPLWAGLSARHRNGQGVARCRRPRV